MKDKIREIILYNFKAADVIARDGVDIHTIIDRWISNILALDEIIDEDTDQAVQNTQEALAHVAAAVLTVVNTAPILVPLIVNPLIEDAAIREYINEWAQACPIKENDEIKTIIEITIERD